VQTIVVGGQRFKVLFPDLLRELAAAERAGLRQSIQDSGRVEVAVVVDEDNGIIDGINRMTLAAELGIMDVPLDVRSGLTLDQKEDLAWALNDHRRHQTQEEKRAAIARRLKSRPEQSNRQTAAAVGVDHKTVAAVREDLEATGEIPQLERTEGADGKARPATRPACHTPRPPAVLATPLPALPDDVLAVLRGEARYAVAHARWEDFLPLLPDGCANDVFTSPPYGDQRKYGFHFNLTGKDWVDWVVRAYREAVRVCVGPVSFVMAGSTRDFRYIPRPEAVTQALEDAGFNLRLPFYFVRAGSIPGGGGYENLRPDVETVVNVSRGGPLPWSDNTACGHTPKHRPGGKPSHRRRDDSRVNGHATRGHRDGDVINGKSYTPPVLANPGNFGIYKVGGGNMGDRLCHENEAPFPEELAEDHIRTYCPPGGLVIDLFCGSGTTGAVAVKLGRRFLGCDIRLDQAELARRRISQVQPNLFTREVAP
jgi:hypothetical protein